MDYSAFGSAHARFLPPRRRVEALGADSDWRRGRPPSQFASRSCITTPMSHKHRLRLRFRSKQPPRWTAHFGAARRQLAEREVGHVRDPFRGPDLKRILMYEGFEGHPLRKDYPVKRRQPLIGPRN